MVSAVVIDMLRFPFSFFGDAFLSQNEFKNQLFQFRASENMTHQFGKHAMNADHVPPCIPPMYTPYRTWWRGVWGGREKFVQIDDWRMLTYRTRAICAFHTPNDGSSRRKKKNTVKRIYKIRSMVWVKKIVFKEASHNSQFIRILYILYSAFLLAYFLNSSLPPQEAVVNWVRQGAIFSEFSTSIKFESELIIWQEEELVANCSSFLFWVDWV